MPGPPPILSAQVPDAWLLTVRRIVGDHNGEMIRKHPTRPGFQTKSVNTNLWGNLMLYTSAMEFVSVEERDLAWVRMWAIKVGERK